MANGLHEKSLAQSETLCTWRRSLRGTWEISSTPGRYVGPAREGHKPHAEHAWMRSRMRLQYRGNGRTKGGNFQRRSWREGSHPRETADRRPWFGH